MNNIKTNFKFFKKYLKENKAYKIYKKTIEKEDEKYYKALSQVEITGKQLQDAKNLQSKTFMSFDKMDEMSQRYSEDTEAATEIAKQVALPVLTTMTMLVPLFIVVGITKGKIPLKGLAKLAFKDGSPVRKFINDFSNVINKNNDLKKNLLGIFTNKEIQNKFWSNPDVNRITAEFFKKNPKYSASIGNILKSGDIKDVKNFIREIFAENGRNDFFSKWVRNLIGDILTLKENKGSSKQKPTIVSNNQSSPRSITDFYRKYKTLSKTILFGGFIPLGAFVFGLPYAIASWLTNIQLKAGKIGMMQAIKDLDNPKLFINSDEEDKKSTEFK